MTRHYPDLGTASDWSGRVGNLRQPIKSTTRIWVKTRHQYGIFCTRFSDVISRGNRLWRCDVSSVFSGYLLLFIEIKIYIKNERDVEGSIVSARWMLSYVARMKPV